MKNYYQILGLKEDASIQEIKTAYKIYAKKFHPDKHNGDSFFAEKFIEIQEAYEYLILNFNREPQDIEIIQFTSDKNTYTESNYINLYWEILNADTIEINIKCSDKDISIKDLPSKGTYRFFAEHKGNIYIYLNAQNSHSEKFSRIIITKSYKKDTWESRSCLGDFLKNLFL